jgi:hypothetical protein
MRGVLITVLGVVLIGDAFAQTKVPDSDPTDNPAANEAATKQAPAPNQHQPQGPTGPTDTTFGGAPASSPQGDTPAGMQPVPNDPKEGLDPKKTTK